MRSRVSGGRTAPNPMIGLVFFAREENMSITPIPQAMASLGLLERVAYEVQTQPETQAAAAQEYAVHTLKQENAQVRKTEAGQDGQKISPDDGEEQAFQRPKRQARGKSKNAAAQSPAAPWSGNLLNVRI